MSLAIEPKRTWKSKYRAQPVVTDEGRFASQREHQHWCISKLRQKAGEITNLQRQVRFRLEHNGIHICDYIADEVFFENNKRVVVDVKGYETPEFKLKRKLMRALYNIEIVTA
jgi:hypothetical protein